MFQSIVRYDQGSGVPGEKAYDGPTRAEPGILDDAATIGRICGEDPTRPGFWAPGKTFTAAVRFALLTTPKQFAARGTVAGGTLAPTMELPANSEAELASMGQFFAVASNPNATTGDTVWFSDTTGEIATVAGSGAGPAGHSKLAYAVVAPLPGGDRATPPDIGMVVVTLNGPMV